MKKILIQVVKGGPKGRVGGRRRYKFCNEGRNRVEKMAKGLRLYARNPLI
jgi:hypothetical protein